MTTDRSNDMDTINDAQAHVTQAAQHARAAHALWLRVSREVNAIAPNVIRHIRATDRRGDLARMAVADAWRRAGAPPLVAYEVRMRLWADRPAADWRPWGSDLWALWNEASTASYLIEVREAVVAPAPRPQPPI